MIKNSTKLHDKAKKIIPGVSQLLGKRPDMYLPGDKWPTYYSKAKGVTIWGLDGKKYAGHSLRSGFATTTAEYGASERNIMAMTGHKSVDMVRRYIKEADLFKNNALNKISNE